MLKLVFYNRRGAFEWPSSVMTPLRISQYSEPEFVVGSPEQQHFLELCSRANLDDLCQSEFWLCPRQEIECYPFFHLHIESLKYVPKNDFLDFSSACPGTADEPCGKGAVQVRKMVLSTSQRTFDIATVLRNGKIHIIVSRKLKVSLEAVEMQGVQFVPCLVEDRDYASSDYIFENVKEDSEYDFFQVVIEQKMDYPASVGQVHITRRCQVCGAVKMFFVDAHNGSVPTFFGEDLYRKSDKIDIMIWDTYDSDNEGIFKSYAEGIIVSSKFLLMLIMNQVTGLRKIMGRDQLNIVPLEY